MDDKFEELKQAVQPVLDFLYKYGDPHATVIVEMGFAKVAQGAMGIPLQIRDWKGSEGRAMAKALTAQNVLEYQSEFEVLKESGFTKKQFVELGTKIRDAHGLTDREAIDVMNNYNVVEILAKHQV